MVNKKNISIAILSIAFGAIGSLAFPPYNIFVLGILSFASIFIITEQAKTKKQTIAFSILWGLGFHVSGLWWIANALLVEGNPYKWAYPLAVLGLPLLLSIFTMLTCLSYKKIKSHKQINITSSAILFALLFSIFEWLRGHIFTGFPWNLPAYIWSEQLEILQSLSFLGAYGLSTATLILSIIVGSIFITREKYSITSLAVITCVFLGLFMWGLDRLDTKVTPLTKENTLIRIIQPNIAQKDKWNPDLFTAHLKKMESIALSPLPENSDHKNVLIVLPETALNMSMMSSPEANSIFNNISSFYTYQGKTLFILSGSLLSNQQNVNKRINQTVYYNSAVLYNQNGEIVDDYTKTHLVPFGEYMPLSSIIDISPIVGFSGFTAGERVKTIHASDMPSFGVAICYEIIFPSKLIDQKDRPDFLITITNDAWYGDTPGPYQHYMMARYRAIEEHLTVIRSANTGISGAFDKFGREIVSIPINTSGYTDISISR